MSERISPLGRPPFSWFAGPCGATARMVIQVRVLDQVSSSNKAGTSAETDRAATALGLSDFARSSSLFRIPVFTDRLVELASCHGSVRVQVNPEWAVVRRYDTPLVEVHCLRRVNGYSYDVVVAANLRRIIASMCPCFDTVIVHSAAVVRKDRVALFVGPDNGGKSTVVRLAGGSPVLHDDQIALQLSDGVVFAHSTPFGRATGGPANAPLGGVFVLEKSDRFSLAPFDWRDLVQMLWQGHIDDTTFLPRRLRLRAFDVLCAAARQASVYRMGFRVDALDWGAIDAALG